jgi:hypothetical protein
MANVSEKHAWRAGHGDDVEAIGRRDSELIWPITSETVIAEAGPRKAKVLLRLLIDERRTGSSARGICATSERVSGRTWDRTRDLSRVKRALSR